MAINSSIIPSSVTANIAGATTQKIYNVTLASANTEYSQALSTDTKFVALRCRGPARLQFTFVSGESGTKYITIWPGSNWSKDNLRLTGATIYFQASLPNQIVEIEEWV